MSEPGPVGGRPIGRNAATPPSGVEFAGAGLQFGLTLVIFSFLGIWLDKRFNSSPWFVLICVFVGASAGFYSIYRRLMGPTRRDVGGGERR